jgi:hypothetical protein
MTRTISSGLRQSARWRAAIAILLGLAALLAAGCGGSGSHGTATSSTSSDTHSISIPQEGLPKLGVSKREFFARYGRPATPFHSKPKDGSCAFYYVSGQPAIQKYIVCFKADKLVLFATSVSSK